MESQLPFHLILSGKSSIENELAKSLKEKCTLKLPDAELSVSLHSEMKNPLEQVSFRINSYMDSLSTKSFGRFLLWSPRLTSTQDVVSQNFSDLPNGAVCVADVQNKGRGLEAFSNMHCFLSFCISPGLGEMILMGSATTNNITHSERGRVKRTYRAEVHKSICICSDTVSTTMRSVCSGRSSNQWESPKGCLLFSFTIQMEDGRVVPLVQYIASLAITEAIKDVAQRNGIPPLDVRIKWPNDLYLDGLKVGGILCTSTYRSKKFNVSAGIGLNVDNEKPTTSLNAALQKLNSSYQLQREDLISAFFNKFEYMFHLLINQGFQPLEELYYKTWLHSGQRVIVQEKREDQDILLESVVTVQGLTPTGYLLAIGDDGQMCELHPDGNRY